MNKAIADLLEMAEDYNLYLIKVDLIEHKAIVEREDGTPMLLTYRNGEWV